MILKKILGLSVCFAFSINASSIGNVVNELTYETLELVKQNKTTSNKEEKNYTTMWNAIENRINLYNEAQKFITKLTNHPIGTQNFEDFNKTFELSEKIIEFFHNDSEALLKNEDFKKLFTQLKKSLDDLNCLILLEALEYMHNMQDIFKIRDSIFNSIFCYNDILFPDGQVFTVSPSLYESFKLTENDDTWAVYKKIQNTCSLLKMMLSTLQYYSKTHILKTSENFSKYLYTIQGLCDLGKENPDIVVNNANFKKTFTMLEEAFSILCLFLKNYIPDIMEIVDFINKTYENFSDNSLAERKNSISEPKPEAE